jgi:hypothetical protein
VLKLMKYLSSYRLDSRGQFGFLKRPKYRNKGFSEVIVIAFQYFAAVCVNNSLFVCMVNLK